jgi:hypothetical protein
MLDDDHVREDANDSSVDGQMDGDRLSEVEFDAELDGERTARTIGWTTAIETDGEVLPHVRGRAVDGACYGGGVDCVDLVESILVGIGANRGERRRVDIVTDECGSWSER